jgi:MarR family 2-MHQ and catechol resistance regulon transcriptional repressor
MATGSHIRLVLGRAAKSVEKVDRASIALSGLNISDFAILEALLHKGPLPINTLGKKVLLTSGSMTAAANRLVVKELVKRVQDSSDGRIFSLHLTKSGRRLISGAFGRHAQNLEKIAAVLSSRERQELVRLLRKLGRYAETLKLRPN